MLQGFLKNPNEFFNMLTGGQAGLNQQLSNTYMNMLGKQNPGADVVNAAQPIFNRNLQQGADIQRQAGPRFASNNERLISDQQGKSIQDFNLFAQQAMESGLNRQLQAASQAGQFSLGQSQLNSQNFQNMFGQAFEAGIGAPIFQQNPGLFQNIMQTIGTVGGVASGFMPFGRGNTTQPNTGGSFQPQPMGGFRPPTFGSSFGQGSGWRP